MSHSLRWLAIGLGFCVSSLVFSPCAAQDVPSVGGAWSDAGQAASITQDPGNPRTLVFINRLGWHSKGTFADANTVIATDWEKGLRGTLQDNGNTIRWANGTVWYRSSQPAVPSLGGAWSDAGQAASITQDPGNPRTLVFTNRLGWHSKGTFADANTVIATEWEKGLRGTLQNNGDTIRWANGTVWYRSNSTGTPPGNSTSIGSSSPAPNPLTGPWVHSANPSAQTPDSRVILFQEGTRVTLTQTYKTNGRWVTLVCQGPISGQDLRVQCSWPSGGNPFGFANMNLDLKVSPDGNHLDGVLTPATGGSQESHYSRLP